jgi:hypothetical protein
MNKAEYIEPLLSSTEYGTLNDAYKTLNPYTQEPVAKTTLPFTKQPFMARLPPFEATIATKSGRWVYPIEFNPYYFSLQYGEGPSRYWK